MRGSLKVVDVPHLINRWDWNKNSVDPSTISHGSSSYFFWLCDQGHSTFAKVRNQFWFDSCGQCRESKGEKRIAAFLEAGGYTFQREYKFPGTEISRMPFDFAVFLPRLVLVEYDGIAHHEPVSFGSQECGYRKFLRTVQNDRRKNAFCGKHSIPLIRIPYYNYDSIEIILKYELDRLA